MITVKGIEVRSEEYAEEVNTRFEYLTEEGQKRLFQENKELFAVDALSSKYEEVRDMVVNSKEEYSSETINSIVDYLLNYTRVRDVDLIIEFLNLKQLDLDEVMRFRLAYGPYDKLRNWVLNDPNTSDDLKKDMLKKGFC